MAYRSGLQHATLSDRLAKKTCIPAFVDDLATSYDQVIENEQREGLTPLELALFVERRMGAGDSQAEIARRLGKSKTYVIYATRSHRRTGVAHDALPGLAL